jgi:carboxyl-terminal processing protease
MRSLVLDIRGNPGGLLDESIEVTDLFLPKGAEIVSTKGRMPETDRVYEARDNDDFSVHPMIVLVDRASASASEILAGALQDHDRALIVGAPTWGKGLVQSLFPLDEGYFLKLTTARYYTPSGRSIQRNEDMDLDFSEVIWPGEVGVPDLEEEIEIPDSLVFRTDMGRTVYGGGGVMPDVMVRGEDIADVSLDLFRDMIATNAFFSFAVRFRASHPSIPRDYMPDDRLIEEFKQFLREKEVVFTEEAFEAERDYLRDFLRYTLISHVHGEGAARQAVMGADLPLTKAVDLLSEAETLADLFRLAERERNAARSAALRPAPSGR